MTDSCGICAGKLERRCADVISPLSTKIKSHRQTDGHRQTDSSSLPFFHTFSTHTHTHTRTYIHTHTPELNTCHRRLDPVGITSGVELFPPCKQFGISFWRDFSIVEHIATGEEASVENSRVDDLVDGELRRAKSKRRLYA